MSATTPPLPSRLRWRQQRTRGALLSSDDSGSSVERRDGCHPVYGDGWRVVRGADQDSVVLFKCWVRVLQQKGGPSGALRAIDSTAPPRSWWTFRSAPPPAAS